MASAPRQLIEAYTETTPLRVDREAGIIYGVRCLGSESRNTYGVPGVIATEYPESAHADVRKLYEGAKCYANHIRDKRQERRAEDALGIFRNCTTKHIDGKPVTFADLHYLKSNKLAESVAEDAERGTGVFGLSHDAYAGSERVDKARKKLVIESIKSVNSIDVVTKPATNRNLSESEVTPMETLKSLIEKRDLTPGKAKWAKRLLEDSELYAAVNTSGSDWADAFESAVCTVINDPALSAEKKTYRIGRLFETRERLESTTDSEPVETPVAEVKKTDDTAAEIARLLGENAKYKAELEVRRLCESEGFAPKPHHIESLQALATEASRKALIADLKQPAAQQKNEVRSGFRRTQESESTVAKDAKSFLASIRN